MRYNFKIIISFFVVLYCIITILFYSFYRSLAVEDTKQEALSVLNTINALRHYIESTQRPLIDRLKMEGKLDKDFYNSKVLSSSYIAKHTYDKLLKDNKINFTYKIASDNPTNPNNKASKFEEDILNQFRQGKISEYFDIKKYNDKKYFYAALPTGKMKASCLSCHGNPKDAPKYMVKQYGSKNGFNDKVGDIRAIISLKVPVMDMIKFHIQEFLYGGLAMLFAFIVFIFLFYMLYKKDLKLQQEREKVLVKQNKLASMGEMINNIAHQWRQPLGQLSSLLVNVQLHSNKNKLTKEILENKIEKANEQIAFMSHTIDDFRTYFVQDKKKQDFKIEEVLKKVNQLVCASLYENSITLNIDIKDNFSIKGYLNEITQALINIVQNSKDAFKDKKGDKYINIVTFTKDDKKIIRIEDNAGGIDLSIIENIFEPYFTTKHHSIGTGIGLYMTKSIIEKKNEGKISVKNSKHGAVFTIVFFSTVNQAI